MTTGKDDKPDRVSGSPRRAQTRPDGDVCCRWQWAEPSVWTRRMLTALDNGVRGGRWHSLIDQCWPTAYFARHGLFSLKVTYELDRQSS
jgi:hypothetical protein